MRGNLLFAVCQMGHERETQKGGVEQCPPTEIRTGEHDESSRRSGERTEVEPCRSGLTKTFGIAAHPCDEHPPDNQHSGDESEPPGIQIEPCSPMDGGHDNGRWLWRLLVV